MSNRTITFKELVRRIHPDYNNDIVDPGSKMNMAKQYRDKPEELYKLALRWGLTVQIQPRIESPRVETLQSVSTPDIIEKVTPAPVKYKWVECPEDAPQVGGYVVCHTKGMTIVKVVKITPKRVYFHNNNKMTYTSKSNVSVIKKEIHF